MPLAPRQVAAMSTNSGHAKESLADDVVLACVLSPLFAVSFVLLRFYTACRILRKVRLDDCK